MSDQTYTRKTYFVNSPSNFPVAVLGRVTQPVELRYTPNGVEVANLSLAVSRRYNQDGEWKEEVTFMRFSLWRQAATRASQTLNVGDVVDVSFHPSSLKARAYANKEGEPAASLDATALGFHKIASSTEFGTHSDATAGLEGGETENEIPF